MTKSEEGNPSTDELRILGELEKKVLWLASWTIHNANHLRENVDGLKVGGHQASSASLATIMTALYFRCCGRRTGSRSSRMRADLPRHPVSLRQAEREKLENFRGYKGAQSYPRAPRTPTTSISRPARSASASRDRSPRWCRTMSAHTAGARAAGRPHDRAGRRCRTRRGQIFEAYSKAGSRACATAGGSSTTIARASTP